MENEELNQKEPGMGGNAVAEVEPEMLPVPSFTGHKPGKSTVNGTVVRVIIQKKGGSVVKISLPMNAIYAMAKGKADSHIASSRSFGDIDFKMVIAMIKTGLTGVLFVVDTKDDERVIVIGERIKD